MSMTCITMVAEGWEEVLTMSVNIPKVYCGAADRQMEGFFTPKTFDDQFLSALLFHGNLVIPDVFFFISSNLEEAIIGKGLKHVLPALRRGLIVPAFREETSFRQILE